MRMRLYPDPMLLKQVMLTTGAATESEGVAIALEMMEEMRKKDERRAERAVGRERGSGVAQAGGTARAKNRGPSPAAQDEAGLRSRRRKE